MGNHERKHVRGILSTSQEIARLQMGASYAADVAWMGTLPYHYEDARVRVVHWGLYPGVPLELVPEEVRSGTTSGEGRLQERLGPGPWYQHYADAKPVVFGHAVIGREPLVIEDRIYGLDTGACHGMALTAVILEERRTVSVPARADHWSEVRRRWQGRLQQAQPWRDMDFAQIERRLRQRDPALDPAPFEQVGRWMAAVQGGIPRLATALQERCEQLERLHGAAGFGAAAASDPAASWLHRFRAGRLSPRHLGCQRPADVFGLAAALSVDLGVPVEP
jgi:serine/threonine protein phosphatase 1